jgi:predicted ribosomally synthesized peptide with nif11-like leader
MSLEDAKLFLVELADDEEAIAKVDAAYRAALLQVAAEHGYDLTDDDLAEALVLMVGLGDDEAEVVGMMMGDSLFSTGALRSFGNPLGFQPRPFGRPGRF